MLCRSIKKSVTSPLTFSASDQIAMAKRQLTLFNYDAKRRKSTERSQSRESDTSEVNLQSLDSSPVLSPGNPVEDQYQSEQHSNHQQCNHVIVQNSSGDTTVIFNAHNTPDQETTNKSLAQNSSVGNVHE